MRALRSINSPGSPSPSWRPGWCLLGRMQWWERAFSCLFCCGFEELRVQPVPRVPVPCNAGGYFSRQPRRLWYFEDICGARAFHIIFNTLIALKAIWQTPCLCCSWGWAEPSPAWLSPEQEHRARGKTFPILAVAVTHCPGARPVLQGPSEGH